MKNRIKQNVCLSTRTMEYKHKIFLKSIREKVNFFAFLVSCTFTITMEKVVRAPPGP